MISSSGDNYDIRYDGSYNQQNLSLLQIQHPLSLPEHCVFQQRGVISNLIIPSSSDANKDFHQIEALRSWYHRSAMSTCGGDKKSPSHGLLNVA